MAGEFGPVVGARTEGMIASHHAEIVWVQTIKASISKLGV